MTVQLMLGVGMAIFGALMIVASMSIPPFGIIDPSVLTALAEFLAFSGTCIGIDANYKIKLHRDRKAYHIPEDVEEQSADNE